MKKLKLTMACGRYDRTQPLIDGRVEPEGVDLTFIPLRPGETFWRMLNHEEFDVSEMSLSSYTILRSEGDTRFIAIPVFPSRVFRHSAVYLRADSKIEKPEDLKGKRIGYGNLGALDHYSMVLFLRKMGWNPDRDVSMLASGNGPQSIVRDLVDAFAGTDIALTAAKKLGLRDLVDLGPYHFVMPGSGVNALSEWLPKNRATAARFMKATVEAIALMKTDKKAAFASMTKWYGISDPEKLEAVYAEAARLPSKPYPSVEGLKIMQSIYTWREMTMRNPEDFTDPSFIAELDRSGYIDSLYGKSAAAKD